MKPFLLALFVGVATMAASERPAQAQYYTYSPGYSYPATSSYTTPNYSSTPSAARYQSYSVLQPSPYWTAYSNYRNSPTYGTSYFPKPVGYAGYLPGYPTFSTLPPARYVYTSNGFYPGLSGYGW